jgi:hypothetical protein
MFFVSVASKRLSPAVNPLDATLMGVLASVASKGLECGWLRLKPGKTRCLFATVHSKGVRGILRQCSGQVGIRREKELRGRGERMAGRAPLFPRVGRGTDQTKPLYYIVTNCQGNFKSCAYCRIGKGGARTAQTKLSENVACSARRQHRRPRGWCD